MDFSIPQWMTADFLKNCLCNDVRYKDIVIKSFSAAPAVPPGNNYGSVILRVGIDYEINERKENVSLIVKCPITEGVLKMITDEFSDTEPLFYNKFIPEAYKKLNYHFAPKTFNSPIHSIVVMEDLKTRGYLVADRIKQLDFEHCLLYAEAAASLHAVSYILYKENPQLISSICSENVHTRENDVVQFYENLCLWGVECMAKHVTDIKIKNVITNSLKKLWGMMIELHRPINTLNCIVQGDPWTTNMMFKYDRSGNVTDIKLIDFQRVTLGSPFKDLLTFIWLSANNDVRQNRLQDLYSHYYNQLNENLKVLKGDQIDYNTFMDNVKKFSPLALNIAGMLPIFISQNPVDFEAIITASVNGDGTSGTNPVEQYYTESYCTKELPLMVRQLEAAGIFEYLEHN